MKVSDFSLDKLLCCYGTSIMLPEYGGERERDLHLYKYIYVYTLERHIFIYVYIYIYSI